MAKQKDQLEELLDQIDFKNLTAEEITGPDGLIKELIKRVIERAMNTEMDEHLGYKKNARTIESKTNARNGNSQKTVKTENGDVSIDIPRDRNGEFDPQIIPKHSRRFKGFDDKIISLYGPSDSNGVNFNAKKKFLFYLR